MYTWTLNYNSVWQIDLVASWHSIIAALIIYVISQYYHACSGLDAKAKRLIYTMSCICTRLCNGWLLDCDTHASIVYSDSSLLQLRTMKESNFNHHWMSCIAINNENN